MADIKAIVQRMIDAGESEENIAKVIQHAKSQNVSVTPVSDEEPGTFWSGFGRSLKDQVLHATVDNPMLQGAAHPQSVGDFANLLVPDAGGVASVAGDAVSRGMSGVIRGLKLDTPVSSLGRAVARGAAQVMEDVPYIRKVTPGSSAVMRGLKKVGIPPPTFNELPLAQQMDKIPSTGVIPETKIAPPPLRSDEPTPFHERPVYQQMENLPSTGTVDRGTSAPPISKIGKETVPTPAPPRLAGRAPTLEEALTQIVKDARNAKEPSLRTTAAPATETAGAGPFKQSWVKTKKQNLGGYSSGRPPALDDANYESMMGRLGKEHLPEDAPITGAGPVPEEAATPDVTVTPTKPKASAEEIAQWLRSEYGSRDGGRMLNPGDPKGGADALKRIAPGPSRTPRVAQNRIDAFNMKSASDNDPDITSILIGALTAGLSGKMLAQSSSDQ